MPAAFSFGDEVAFFHVFPDPQLQCAVLPGDEQHELSAGEGFVIGQQGDDFPGKWVAGVVVRPDGESFPQPRQNLWFDFSFSGEP
jgi:hypothetical protein